MGYQQSPILEERWFPAIAEAGSKGHQSVRRLRGATQPGT